jgi:hypothetical protein
MTESSDQHLVEVWVRTHHPEHYHLVNTHDWTVWKIVDGRWEEVGESQEVATQTGLVQAMKPRGTRRKR